MIGSQCSEYSDISSPVQYLFYMIQKECLLQYKINVVLSNANTPVKHIQR